MAAVFVLMMVDGLHFVFARMLLPRVSPEISAFYVLLIGTIEVGIFTLLTGKLHFSTFKKNFWVFLVIGFLVATSTNINYEAVAFVDAGTASLLNEVSIIFGLMFGLLWLKEKLSTPQLWGSLLAIAGVFVINYQSGDYLRLGSLMILGGSLMYAAHAAITKRYTSEINLGEFFFLPFIKHLHIFIPFLSWQRRTGTAQGRSLAFSDFGCYSRYQHQPHLVLCRPAKTKCQFPLCFAYTLSPVVTIFMVTCCSLEKCPGTQQLLGGAAVIAGVMLVTYYRNKKTKKTA